MAEVLYAFEIWMLVASLVGWFFSRAAIRLRQPPPTLAEVLLAAQLRDDECMSREPSVFDRDSLRRAVRVYERA